MIKVGDIVANGDYGENTTYFRVVSFERDGKVSILEYISGINGYLRNEYGYYPFITESLILYKEKDSLILKNLKKFSMG